LLATSMWTARMAAARAIVARTRRLDRSQGWDVFTLLEEFSSV
jgi:hypothetical protein